MTLPAASASGVPPALAAGARRCAEVAASRIGVTVGPVTDLEAASLLLQRVWQAQHPAEVAGAGLLRTYEHSGNYVAGAYRDGTLVGAAVGFFGRSADGHPHLHSYVAGVERGGLGKGVGFALKQHQRAWSLSRDVTEVHWTFDPLVLRNAYFNLCKLGGSAVGYLPEFYGPMTDGINRGDLSDRLYVVWRLDTPGAISAAEGAAVDVDVEGTVKLLERSKDSTPVLLSPHGQQRALCALPLDIERLRVSDPGSALRWRHAVREILTARLAAGWRIDGVTRDGYYLLCEETADAPARP